LSPYACCAVAAENLARVVELCLVVVVEEEEAGVD